MILGKSKILLLVIGLILILVTGCRSTETQKNAVTTEKGNEEESANDKQEKKKVKVEKENPLSFSLGIRSIGYFSELENPNDDPFIQTMNEKFNINLDLKYFDSKRLRESMQLMFASGDVPDVLVFFDNYSRTEMAGSVEAGVFMPLDKLLEKHKDELPHLLGNIPEATWKFAKFPEDGKIYGLPGRYLSETTRRGVYIRKDFLDKYGLEIPVTLDEYVNVMRVFKENGVPYPYSGREKFNYTDVFFGAFGAFPQKWGMNEEGQIVPDIIRPEMKEALAFHAMLREEGLMDSEAITNKGSVWADKIKSGKVGIWGHNAASMANWSTELKENVPDAEVILIPAPVGEKGHKGIFNYSPLFQSIYINKKFKEPLRVLKVLDMMASQEGQEFFAYGFEGVHHTKKDDGTIEFKYPEDSEKAKHLDAIANLNLIGNAAYNDLTLPYMPKGKELMNWFKEVATQEGYINYDVGNPEILREKSELKPGSCDLFNEYAAKIFLGTLSPEAHDEFVKEYLKRGGDKIIDEVNKLYKEGKVLKLE